MNPSPKAAGLGKHLKEAAMRRNGIEYIPFAPGGMARPEEEVIDEGEGL
jgi:hypothetical protein